MNDKQTHDQPRYVVMDSGTMNSYQDMDEVKRSGPQLDDVPDLFHKIQSLLPVKDAARTSMLSKSWLHAWSTIPTLRFCKPSSKFVYSKRDIRLIHRTLQRYYQHNIPIQTFNLRIKIENKKSASLVNKWIQKVATQRCLNNFSLVICNFMITNKFILPDEIFSGENLYTINISRYGSLMGGTLSVTRNYLIKCASLRVLELFDVEISDEVLNNLFSTCTLLEKIDLSSCTGFTKIKIKNLHYLQKFRLVSYSKEENYEILEVNDVPNLQIFQYESDCWFYRRNPTAFNIDSLSSSMTELSLIDVMIDVSYFDKIVPKFPFLESLRLEFHYWSPGNLNITSASLKTLNLRLLFEYRQTVDVQVYAPKLLHLFYSGTTIANLSLQNNTIPEQIQLDDLELGEHTDNRCLYKLRELLLSLSRSKFDIGIGFDCHYDNDVLDMDIDDLKKQFQFPATNVQKLSFYGFSVDGLVHPSYFDALFTICHPKSILAGDITHNYRNLISELVRRKTLDLKHIEFKNPINNKWEELTDSITPHSFKKYSSLEFKPYWCSP